MNPSHSCNCIDLKVTPPTGVTLRVSPYIPRLKPLGFTGSSNNRLRRLADVRTQLAEWLRSGIPQEIRLDDFPDENPVGLRQWFVGKVHAAMVLINFVELNKDKPNLRIELIFHSLCLTHTGISSTSATAG